MRLFCVRYCSLQSEVFEGKLEITLIYSDFYSHYGYTDKPKDKLYRLYDGGGLILNIAKSGTKTWYYQYKYPTTNKSDMFKLGRYPAVSLLEVRQKWLDAESLLADGINPKEKRDKE